MVADCVGLIKAFFWTSNGTTDAKYAVNGCPDRSANGMFSECKVKGAIGTLPAVPGLVLWKDGHIGVSLDGVWAIEAKSFSDGIVKTRIKDRGWTNWGQLPTSMLTYIGDIPTTQPEPEAPKPSTSTPSTSKPSTSTTPSTPDAAGASECPYPEPTSNLKKDAKGDGVKWIQWMLVAVGYSVGSTGIDGKFGDKTLAAVKSFQKAQNLSVDGIVGPLTRSALKSALSQS